MAEDAMAVLEAAGVREPAFVLGASMGGMIAQEIALRYPDRFRALLLACTGCGPLLRAAWPNFKRSPGFWNWYRLKGEARERALVRMLYSDFTPPERIEEDFRIRAARQPSIGAVVNQLAGIVSWSSYRRLPQLNLPALVAHGDQDHILPAANGAMLARRLPNCEFVVLPNCGHMIMTDQPARSLQVIQRFLERVTAGVPHRP
jgi:pimeloyl-ACP methyl ester carboxylesterase